ncbi:MAG: DUF116 domain-containing protein [Planctomycetaceae bacterium]|nr:DUF116 domain-containing protein [Planctomycetaceae bacterium]
MFNNALWEICFFCIPKEQRLLLLPFCLRNYDQCKAPRDDLGLICNQCGKRGIPYLSDQADVIGMPMLVAESSSMGTQTDQRTGMCGVFARRLSRGYP